MCSGLQMMIVALADLAAIAPRNKVPDTNADSRKDLHERRDYCQRIALMTALEVRGFE